MGFTYFETSKVTQKSKNRIFVTTDVVEISYDLRSTYQNLRTGLMSNYFFAKHLDRGSKSKRKIEVLSLFVVFS